MVVSQTLYHLIRNLGDVVLLIMFMNRLLPVSCHSEKWSKAIACGLTCSMAGILSMLMPIHLPDGIILDMRIVPVALGSFYGGGLAAAICVTAVSAFRLCLSGTGVTPGVIVIVTAAAVGLLFRAIPFPHCRAGQLLFSSALGLILTAGHFGWSFLFQTPMTQLLLSKYVFMYLFLYPLAACTIVYIFQAERTRKTADLFDPSSGIPNKNWLLRRLRKLIEKQVPFHLIAFRIENLRAIHAVHGPEYRQLILQEMSARFSNEQLIHAGNQEFMLCCYDSERILGMDAFMDGIRQRLTKPFLINNKLVYLFSNTSFLPYQGEAAEHFIQKALSTLQETAGECLGESYSEEALLRRYQLQDALYQALSKEQLLLHYQPQFDLQNGRLRGFEALLRWNHPELGPVSPAEFIPIAEETGLIRQIGLWVLEQACLVHLQILPVIGDITMSVNISAVQLSDPFFPDEVNRVLERSGLPPSSIELEITETTLISSFARAERQLQRLESFGVMLALDDFGTGYSSLNYLKSLPLHTLKIDRSFTQGVLNNRESTIMQSIVQLAKQLEYIVIAEGVENEEQLSELKKLKCDVAQGYLLSQPLPSDCLAGFLARLQTNSGEKPQTRVS
ncbi:EAL domain-containing protein [Paenibacillus hexagrammi]|uniref:EAL domain-containing protein n=1 Tax=Paenibacillus hexagrammi TaxID=2908839 RepID=A0ABY3SGB1_9BACL|nr:EAL domain-containing protein [Paenibacillus sp. YPD9-1]UJF32480.1 EAL domain-containing protein [Paenibacillus sp. YPD9-1]